MTNIFTLENFTELNEKINMDELYEKKRQYDLNKLELFKKILNRIHVRIKTISNQVFNEKICWFVVPEVIIGVPKYDQAGCIAYVMDNLQTNGFKVKYFHPNTICISWNHWVPSYVRNEIKKKTGIVVNEYGETVQEEHNEEEYQEIQPQELEVTGPKESLDKITDTLTINLSSKFIESAHKEEFPVSFKDKLVSVENKYIKVSFDVVKAEEVK